MNVLLIGKRGQLAGELIRAFMPLGNLEAVDYPDFDITSKEMVEKTVKSIKPDLVINASAYTNVDLAESERDKAFAVNAAGPGYLALACKEIGIPLIHYSTDFVFDGTKTTPYVETDQTNPHSAYGESKLKGEQEILAVTDAALVFRLAWLYTTSGNSFVSKVQQWAMKNKTLTIVDDQVGNPTWARFTAEATAMIVRQGLCSGKPLNEWVKERNGVYHLTSSGEASRYDWGCEILRLASEDKTFTAEEIIRGKTVDFPAPAERPAYSPLDCSKVEKTFDISVPDWKTQLRLCMGK